MAKQKPKVHFQENLRIAIDAIYEGEVCTAVRVVQPYLSPEKTANLGRTLIKFGCLLARLNDWQDEQDKIQSEIGALMSGR